MGSPYREGAPERKPRWRMGPAPLAVAYFCMGTVLPAGCVGGLAITHVNRALALFMWGVALTSFLVAVLSVRGFVRDRLFGVAFCAGALLCPIWLVLVQEPVEGWYLFRSCEGGNPSACAEFVYQVSGRPERRREVLRRGCNLGDVVLCGQELKQGVGDKNETCAAIARMCPSFGERDATGTVACKLWDRECRAP